MNTIVWFLSEPFYCCNEDTAEKIISSIKAKIALFSNYTFIEIIKNDTSVLSIEYNHTRVSDDFISLLKQIDFIIDKNTGNHLHATWQVLDEDSNLITYEIHGTRIFES